MAHLVPTLQRFAFLFVVAVAAAGCGRAARGTAPPIDACAKTTCVAEHKNCGAISDGCGGVLDCGGCAANDTCGGGGEENVCGQGGCPDGLTMCGGHCVDVTTDTANCGACGSACQLPNASADCQLGQCLIHQCGAGYADCDGVEANGCEAPLLTDGKNCGGCGTACADTQTCINGVCSGAVCAQCPVGFADCDCNPANGCEVNTSGDPANCGACKKVCPSVSQGAAACSGGLCSALCNRGWADCNGSLQDGCEIHIDGDPANCGACGAPCPNGNLCIQGQCVASMPDAGVPPDLAVPVDLAVPADLAAPVDLAPAADLAPAPDLRPDCMAGFADCDGDPQNGCEVSLLTDPANCGSCNTACAAIANGFAACLAGTCGVGGCNVGFADCDKNAGNGCEVGINSDPGHCGSCGTSCPSVAHGTNACVAGQCGIGSCNAGFDNCDNDPSNGCEADLFVDVQHCGSCGTACAAFANATSVCSVGMCRIGSCLTGFDNCDGDQNDGCEVSLLGDPNHCGNCNTVCPAVPNGAAGCAMGSCGVGACYAGFGDCNHASVDGCEKNLLADPANCGGCGMACPMLANAVTSCGNGVCGFSQCFPGFGDCDGMAGDGCEVDLTSTLANCGACGNACPSPANGSPACAMGVCGLGSCNGGFGDCDNNAGNGCETNLSTSASNCGACGNACPVEPHGSAVCSNGACGLGSCTAGWGDCDGNTGNGCETNTSADPANCGGCGKACAAVQNGVANCSNSKCGVGSCNAGFGNCDNNSTNGCETNLNTDRNNCGSCGRRCSGNRNCVNGNCQ